MTNTITLRRVAQRRSNPVICRRQIDEIIERGFAAGRKKLWQLSPIPSIIDPVATDEGWLYKVLLELTYTGRGDQKIEEQQLEIIKGHIDKTAKSKGGWSIENYEPKPIDIAVFNGLDMIADIPIERGNYFDHLYGLDAQISILLSALQVAKDTDYTKRFHAILYGPPGSGKSETLHCLKNMIGDDGVIEFDGTQTTAAGAISTIIAADVLPPLLIIEEIEKVPDAAFMWLLSALDGRAEIKKVTNWGTQQRKVPFVCFATVNDLPLFESRHQGAMASRFSHKLYCHRPSESILKKILNREVESMGGDPVWVEPAIRYCIDTEQTTDPRRVIAVCLTGRYDLMDGTFQRYLTECKQHG